jgi:hypothetical protein
MRSMSAATIKRLELLEATRAFDRKLILEEDGRASSSRVLTGAKLGEAEPLSVYFCRLRHGRMLPAANKRQAKPFTQLPGKAP